MIQRLRERLTLLLIALLPLHAFLVTVGTRLLTGKGHAPLAYLAVWKEALLGVILLLVILEVVRAKGTVRIDAIDLLVLSLMLLGALVTVFTHQDWRLALLGFRYDFIPLVAFLLARRVPWSAGFEPAAVRVLIGVGAVLAVYGLLTSVLPIKFFLWLGYSPAHSLYFADGPLAAFQQVSETTLRRIQSTLSGPNQFGLWLLLPWAALLTQWRTRYRQGIFWMAVSVTLAALLVTFSRAAWIGAFVIGSVVLFQGVPRKHLRCVAVGSVLLLIALAVVAALLFPSIVFRLSSSRGHLVRPLQAIARMAAHPLGQGLGTAGPASNRANETCVFLRPQDDPSWAKTTPRLCVFLGTTQVQPVDHLCRCPFLPENWYLQIGVEMGVLGCVLFLTLVMVVLRRMSMQYAVRSTPDPARGMVFLAFLGISIAALFLHAWEDSAIAYSLWLLAASSLPLPRSA